MSTAPLFAKRNGTWDPYFARAVLNMLDEEDRNVFHKDVETLEKIEIEDVRTAKFVPVPEIHRFAWDALERMGFEGGRVLVRNSGMGYVAGLVPDQIREKTRITVSESAYIDRLLVNGLYGSSKGMDVRTDPEDLNAFPENFYDAGFVQFDENPGPIVSEFERFRSKDASLPAHGKVLFDSLDALRPGGALVVVSYFNFMNSPHPAIAQTRSDLFERAAVMGMACVAVPGAYEIPVGTKNPATVLVLVKRQVPGIRIEGEIESASEAGRVEISETWAKRPHDINVSLMGDPGRWRSFPVDLNKKILEGGRIKGNLVINTSGTNTLGLGMRSEKTLEESLGEFLQELPEGLLKKLAPAPLPPKFVLTKKVQDLERKWLSVPSGSYVLTANGEIMVRENGADVFPEKKLSAPLAARLKKLIPVRASAVRLKYLEESGAPDAEIEAARQTLNRTYDAFHEDYGALSNESNYRALDLDPKVSLLLALEKEKEGTGNEYEKGEVFFRRILFPDAANGRVSVKDALLVFSAGNFAIDIPSMETSTGLSWPEIEKEAADLIVEEPDGTLVTKQSYLSGNVREKLKVAELAARVDPKFEKNVEVLKTVLPKEIGASDISVQLSSPWIPEKVIAHFAETIMTDNPLIQMGSIPGIWVNYSPVAGWNVGISDKNRKRYDSNLTAKFGTDRLTAMRLLEYALNNQVPTLSKPNGIDPDTKKPVYVYDEQATEEARSKITIIKEQFEKWVFDNPMRIGALVDAYNEKNNSHVPPRYSGEVVTLYGVSPSFGYREYQIEAVSRYLQTGNTLLNMPVGSGKTAIMAAIAMESKRLGISEKPAIVVPNHLVNQFAGEFRRIFPSANILTVGPDSFRNPKNRARILDLAGDETWDAVIFGSSAFQMIEIGKEAYRERLLEHAALLSGEIAGVSLRLQNDKKNEAIKKAAADLKSEERRVRKKIQDIDKIPDGSPLRKFETLGIDTLMLDESHALLKNMTTIGSGAVMGISDRVSQRADNFAAKLDYVAKQRDDGRGILLSSGSALTNRIHKEAFDILRILNKKALDDRGFYTLQSFLGTHAIMDYAIEATVDGQSVHQVPRILSITNIPEFKTLLESVAFTRTQEELNLKLPNVRRIDVVTEPSPYTKAYVEYIADRAENKTASVLKLTTEAYKLCVDERFLSEYREQDEQSQIAALVRNILDERDRSALINGTQLVFLDIGVPGTVTKLNLYQDIKDRLVEEGMPEGEIAFIHDAEDDDDLDRMREDVRTGRIRLLMLPSQKGTGLNVHERMVALHHYSLPWNPDDIEQREGRIRRFGNINEEVRIYTYLTTNIAQHRLGVLKRKADLIRQAFRSGNDGSIRHVDNAVDMDYMDLMAAATGNQDIKERAEISKKLSVLTILSKADKDMRLKINASIRHLKEDMEYDLRDLAHRREFYAKNPYDRKTFSISIKTKEGFEDLADRTEACEKLASALMGAHPGEIVARFLGRDIFLSDSGKIGFLDWERIVGPEVFTAEPKSEKGSRFIRWMSQYVFARDESTEYREKKKLEKESQLGDYEKVLAAPFKDDDLIEELKEKEKILTKRIVEFQQKRKDSRIRERNINVLIPFGSIRAVAMATKELGSPDSTIVAFSGSGFKIETLVSSRFRNGKYLSMAKAAGIPYDLDVSDFSGEIGLSVDGLSLLKTVKLLELRHVPESELILLTNMTRNRNIRVSTNHGRGYALESTIIENPLKSDTGHIYDPALPGDLSNLFSGKKGAEDNPLGLLSRAALFTGDDFYHENSQYIGVDLSSGDRRMIGVKASTGSVFYLENEKIPEHRQIEGPDRGFFVDRGVINAVGQVPGEYRIALSETEQCLYIDHGIDGDCLIRTVAEVRTDIKMPDVSAVLDEGIRKPLKFDIDLTAPFPSNGETEIFVDKDKSVHLLAQDGSKNDLPGFRVSSDESLKGPFSIRFKKGTIEYVAEALEGKSVSLEFMEVGDHLFPVFGSGSSTIVTLPALMEGKDLPVSNEIPLETVASPEHRISPPEENEQKTESLGRGISLIEAEEMQAIEKETIQSEVSKEEMECSEPMISEVNQNELEISKIAQEENQPDKKIEYKRPDWLRPPPSFGKKGRKIH